MTETIQTTRERITDKRVLTGLDQLDALVPHDARFSWLTGYENINVLYARALGAGRKKNSVRRSLHRAICEVLQTRLRRSQMLAIIADADVPGEDDERIVDVTTAELDRLLSECGDDIRDLVELAMLTGIDQGPLLRLKVRAFRDRSEEPHLWVADTKTKARPRTLALGQRGAMILRRLVAGRRPRDSMFDITYKEFRSRWESARKRADLEHVRFKDLRGVFATAFLGGGGNPKDLMHILGHTNLKMTLRYVRRMPNKQHDAMDAAARTLGRDGSPVKEERGDV